MAFLRAEVYRSTRSSPFTYADLDRRQQELRERVRAGEPGKILLAEVASVVTLGLRNTFEDLLLDPNSFAAQGVQIYPTSRGGRATYHGPGQWIAFPVESLERLTGDRKGVRKATERLLEAARTVCRERFPRAEIRDGKEAGVWTERGPQGGKLAAMGLRFEGGILQHGLALNVFRAPESFVGIRPCGLDAPIAFLENGEFSEDVFTRWGKALESELLRKFPSFRV